ncbi:hypothetical protein HGRIS_000355 [Hohenbuehelia grisea]|uniref:DNA repair protein rhp7 treble clef domain-containing protein n=1 Tax=Hohenbuehelia grisea TaxID=104357 RepID=A0ABR3JRR0_9AGAR
MSRNNVRGPTSALTEFLRTQGITPTTVARRAATRAQNQDENQPEAGPSTPRRRGNGSTEEAAGGDDQPEGAEEEDNEGEEASPRRRRSTRAGNAAGYASEELDEPEEEPATKKRKLTKAAEAKLKAQEKAKVDAKAKAAQGKGKKGKGKKDEDEYHDEEEDAYTALSKSLLNNAASRPPVGSFETCAACGKQFTVTKYTIAANPGPGFLCHPCAKAGGTDPFKKSPAKKTPRKRAADKRQVVNYEERRFPSLISLCVKIISKHIDDIEAFGDIGAMNMDSIAKAISKNRSLTPENVQLFYGAHNTALTLYDATKLTAPAFSTLSGLNPNLTSLRIDFCGHINDGVLVEWAQAFPSLKHLELHGPFLAKPAAWIAFITGHGTAPCTDHEDGAYTGLETFRITQSPRFDIACVRALVSSFKNLKDLRLREVGQLDDAFLAEIAKIHALERLDIAEPAKPNVCSEKSLVRLLRALGSQLKALDVSGHASVTDWFLEAGLRANTQVLTELVMSECETLTDKGLSKFFERWSDASLPIDGPPPKPEIMVDDVRAESPLSDDDAQVDGNVSIGRRGPRTARGRGRGRGRGAARGRGRTSTRGRAAAAPPAERSSSMDIDAPEADQGPSMPPTTPNPPLVMLDLSRNPDLGSASLSTILAHSGPSLQRLSINGWKDVGCEGLDDIAALPSENNVLSSIADQAKDLKQLDVGWCRAFDDFVMRSVVEGCKRLEELKVWGCNRVTGAVRRRGVVVHGVESHAAV